MIEQDSLFKAAARELLMELYRETGAEVATRNPERPDDEKAAINIIAARLESAYDEGYGVGREDGDAMYDSGYDDGYDAGLEECDQ